MPEVGGARVQWENGLTQVTAEAKLIRWPRPTRPTREAKELIHYADGNGICDIEFGTFPQTANCETSWMINNWPDVGSRIWLVGWNPIKSDLC